MLMFRTSLISNSVRYTPLLLNQRWKVRILPREHYGDDETPFMKPRNDKSSFFMDVLAFLHKKHSWAQFWNWMKWSKVEDLRKSQKYIPERHEILGPDLATAHFITARDGQIKFFGSDKWITRDDLKRKRIPSSYKPNFFIEEVNVSEIHLYYEGFQNLCNLTKLKKLIIQKSPTLDDWCLSRFHLFASTLEYLDISGCSLVTERGICTLHVLKKLKTLIINDTPNIRNKELVSLLLQDIIPECEVIGVNYEDPVLLKRLASYMN